MLGQPSEEQLRPEAVAVVDTAGDSRKRAFEKRTGGKSAARALQSRSGATSLLTN